MQQIQTIKPVLLNLDTSPKYLPVSNSHYLLNNEVAINPNGAPNGGASLGKSTPAPANFPACEIDQPAGENYVVMKYHSERSNETYSGVYNSNGVHYIQRINGNGQCQIVYVGDCLNFSAAPRHSIEDWRSWMRIEKVCPNRDGKYLQFVDGNGMNFYLDVEASIATNFFTTPFFDICPDPCAYIQLCVPQTCGCLHGEFIPLDIAQQGLNNNLLDKGFKFMYKHVYYDGRESEWSDRSTLYYQDSKRCFFDGVGSARCIKLRVPVGNPMVDRIKIAFSEDGGVTWFEYETVDKYKKYNSAQQLWYTRALSEEVSVTFSDVDCSFDYIFCNDKGRKSIAPEEVSRVRNPYPRKPQFIFPIGEAVAFGNYEDGVCPIDKTEIEKVSIAVDCPVDGCDIEYATVTARVIVHTLGANNSFIYTLGNEGTQDTLDETVYFGGNSGPTASGGQPNNLTTFGQEFKGKVKNFIVYIEGTGYWGEMQQWKSDAFLANAAPYGVVRNMNDTLTANSFNYFISDPNNNPGGFFFQQYKFKVPKGTKGFIRLVSHERIDGATQSQNTSTTVLGVTDINQYHGWVNIRNQTALGIRDLYFDTCNGDSDCGGLALVVSDVANPLRTAYSGYIKTQSGLPVEGTLVFNSAIPAPYNALPADHNGFYYFTRQSSAGGVGSFQVGVYVEQDCAGPFTSIQNFFLNEAGASSIKHDEQIANTHFNDHSIAYIIVEVRSCSGNVVQGITVALSGSKARTTNLNGVAIFNIRNYPNRNRTVTAIIMDNNGCFTQDCNGNCNPCATVLTSTTQPCYADFIPTFFIGTAIINIASILNRVGLKSGGVYSFAAVVEGDCGYLSAAYEIAKFNIPKTQEKNHLSFCDLSYDATGVKLPSWAKCFKITRSENLNPFELQWVVDKIQRDANGRMVLTIQSLNDYNESFFFKTNTIYQYLKGDRIEFIRNGDGRIFSSAQYGNLNFLTVSPFRDISIGNTTTTDPDYFNQLIIIDDGRLADLVEGAVIELQRSKSMVTEIAYKEICMTVPVIQVDNGDGTTHGELLNQTGAFETFDTYLIPRRGNNFIGLFEHHSPSDFWGDHLDDTGKVHFVNKFETERRFGRRITIASPTVVNYFGSLVKQFDAEEQGDIMAMRIVDDNLIQAICEHDNFIAQAANDLLRIDSTGLVKAQSPDSIISDPQAKPFGTYGCQYDHIGSILFGDGYAVWADVNNFAYVKHDYSQAKDVSEGKVKLYTQKRFQQLEFTNRNEPDSLNKLRFVTGQNTQTKAVYLTIKKLRDSGINNEKRPFLKTNDTIVFHPDADEFLGFASFTPEAFSKVNLFDGSGAAFISYLNGQPFYHPVLANKWLEFYGQTVDWMVGISPNVFADKEKVFLSMQQQSETFFFVDSVETDKQNFISEIPPVKFKKQARHWNASFLGNKNSREGLFGNELPKGSYAKILLIRDNTINLAYNTIDDNKRRQYSELDQIIIKMALSEESGFTNNR